MIDYYFKYDKIDDEFYRKLLKNDHQEDKQQEKALDSNQIIKFLDDLRLSNLSDIFVKNDISLENLLTFKDIDLINVKKSF